MNEPESDLIRTYLRPDFHQWFPVFDSRQLAERLETVPFHMATLLGVRNLRIALRLAGHESYLRYLRQPVEKKREQLIEVLTSCGIFRPTAEAVAADRHEFVRPLLAATAYTNRSPNVVGETFLTSPDLLGLMIELSLRIPPPATVCEIGIGTGFHAMCLARLWPQARFVGVERNLRARGACVRHLGAAGLSDRFDLLDPFDKARAIGGAQFVYATAAVTAEQLSGLLTHGAPGSWWLVPRQLTAEEFDSEPPSSWLRQRYGSYGGYTVGWWNQYVALELFELGEDGTTKPAYTLYDVRFVRYKEGRV